jgi:guanylate kinase
VASRRDVGFSVSATTRPPRENERHSVDYYFYTREEFCRRRDAGEFLEWAEYSGHLYGTLNTEVERELARGRHVLLDIEIQGARQVRARRRDAVAIFVLPPSAEVLMTRLRGRGSESPEEVQHRLARADDELQAAPDFDHVVVNDRLDRALDEIAEIIDGGGDRTRRLPDVEAWVRTLRRDLARYRQENTNSGTHQV